MDRETFLGDHSIFLDFLDEHTLGAFCCLSSSSCRTADKAWPSLARRLYPGRNDITVQDPAKARAFCLGQRQRRLAIDGLLQGKPSKKASFSVASDLDFFVRLERSGHMVSEGDVCATITPYGALSLDLAAFEAGAHDIENLAVSVAVVDRETGLCCRICHRLAVCDIICNNECETLWRIGAQGIGHSSLEGELQTTDNVLGVFNLCFDLDDDLAVGAWEDDYLAEPDIMRLFRTLAWL